MVRICLLELGKEAEAHDIYLECLQAASRMALVRYDGDVGYESGHTLLTAAMCPFADFAMIRQPTNGCESSLADATERLPGFRHTDCLIDSWMGRVPRGLLAGRIKQFFGREAGRLILGILE